jgi:hypothetical protein
MNCESIVCIDNSGSTGNCTSYWNSVKNIIMNEPEYSTYIYWNSDINLQCLTKKDALQRINHSTGGTNPMVFLNRLPKHIKNLKIVTDGQIPNESVVACDYKVKEYLFEKVTVYLLGSNDVSVVAPFIRKTDYKIYTENDVNLFKSGNTTVDINVLKYKNNPTLFLSEYENIYSNICAKFIGIGSQELRNDLVLLQKNLLNYISKENKNCDIPLLRTLIKTDLNKSYEFAKKNFLLDNSSGKEIEANINKLIQLCDNIGSYSLDAFRPQRLVTSEVVDENDEIEELHEDKVNYKFECPILMDNDIPCILIKEFFNNITKDLDKGYLNTLLTQPLFFLTNNELKNKIKQNIDSAIGYETLKNINLNNEFISPYTRSEISSSLILHKDAYKSNCHAISRIFFGDKLIGNVALYLTVLYYCILEIEFIDQIVKDTFKEFLLNHLKCNNTFITLTGLAVKPMIQVPNDIAIWYCINSPFITLKDTTEENRLKALCYVSDILFSILDLLEYKYDPLAKIKVKYYKAFNKFYNLERKRLESHSKDNFRDEIYSMVQNFIKITDKIILIDGPNNDNQHTLNISNKYEGLSFNELNNLLQLVDLQNKWTNTVIKDNYDYDSGYQIQNKYNNTYFDYEVLICKNTLRPYTIDKNKNIHWKESLHSIVGDNLFISTNKHYIDYIINNKKYPSVDELVYYIYNKINGPLSRYIYKDCTDVIKNYDIVKPEDVNDFITIVEKSQNIEDRIKLEENIL